jgi:hypothetical protein
MPRSDISVLTDLYVLMCMACMSTDCMTAFWLKIQITPDTLKNEQITRV